MTVATPESAAPAEPGAPPPLREVLDGVGHRLRAPVSPRRILSMAPSVTEMLYALGAGGRIVGISDFCPVPPGGGSPARIGGLINPDVERIVALRPDLAVATTSGNYLEDRDRLERLGIPVYTCDTPDVASILGTVERLGTLIGMEAEGRAIASGLRSRLEAVASRLEGRRRPRVLFVLWGDPLMAPGRGAFLGDALALAGANSISAEAPVRWAEYDLERVLVGRPEIILAVPDSRAFAESLRSRPEWENVPAVRSGRVHVVSDAILQPGPRIVDGIEEVSSLLHPSKEVEPPGGAP